MTDYYRNKLGLYTLGTFPVVWQTNAVWHFTLERTVKQWLGFVLCTISVLPSPPSLVLHVSCLFKLKSRAFKLTKRAPPNAHIAIRQSTWENESTHAIHRTNVIRFVRVPGLSTGSTTWTLQAHSIDAWILHARKVSASIVYTYTISERMRVLVIN